MKKITAFVAALAIALSLTACGDSSNTSLIGKLIGQSTDTNNSSSGESKTEITKSDKNTNNVIDDIGSTETFTTAKTEKITVTETAMQNVGDFSMEKKSFKFNGGNIDCVEYKYYGNYDYYDDVIEYINVSAKIKLDNYPNSENAINDVLNNYIFHEPTEEELIASKTPTNVNMIKTFSHSHLNSVCIENNLLFVSTYYSLEDKNYEDISVATGTTYVFDIKTGNQLEIEQCFKDFDEIEDLVYAYSPILIMAYIDLDNYEWYYDGKNFTFKFDPFGRYTYDESVNIPADDIRPYFVSGSVSTESGSVSKLADIVGGLVVIAQDYNSGAYYVSTHQRDFNFHY